MRWSFLIGGTDRFQKNFAQLAISNTGAQLIGLLTLPVLSRLFSPSDFGVLSAFSAIYSICLSISAFRLDWMIPRAKTEKAAFQLISGGMLIVIAISLFLVVLIAVLGFVVPHVVERYSLGWLPIALLFGGAFLLFQAERVWSGTLKKVAIARVAQAVAVFLFSLLLGLILEGRKALIGGYILGLIVSFIVVVRGSSVRLRYEISRSLSNVMKILRRRHEEIFSQLGSSLVNIMLTSSPLLLLVWFFGNSSAGGYSVAFRVAVAPLGMITGAVAYSFITEVADMARARSSELLNFYRHTICKLTVIGGLSVVVALVASFLLPVLLGGGDWEMSGRFLAAVTPYLFGVIVFSPTTHLFIYGKSHWQLLLDAFTLLIVLVIYIICKFLWNSPVVAVFLSSLCMLGGYLVRHKAHLIAISAMSSRGGIPGAKL